MAEESEAQGGGAEASGAGIDPAAVALALGGADRAEANAYLKDQRAFIAKQSHHLDEQLKQLHLNILEKYLGVLLRIATAFVGVAVAMGLALMIWDAAHANGLVIDSFSVPADMSAQGLTGQVVATQVLDKLTRMQTLTTSVRAPRTYANNWGDDIKVEIPETGVSIGEAWRFLRGWLGHETHISGEVFHTATGIAITARIGSDGGATFTGAESDLDAMEQKAAEKIYASSQPFRYSIYLGNNGRDAEADDLTQALLDTGPSSERSWLYNTLGNRTRDPAPDAALKLYQQGMEADPANDLLATNVANQEEETGRAEQALLDTRKALALLSGKEQGQIRQDYIASFRERLQAHLDGILGDAINAALEYVDYTHSGQATGRNPNTFLAEQQIKAHDIGAARATIAGHESEEVQNAAAAGFSPPSTNIKIDPLDAGQLGIEIAALEGDWDGAVRQAAALQSLFSNAAVPRKPRYHLNAELSVALAEAKLGRVADAEARVADTPADCYQCLRMRARIAEVKGDHAGADVWFGRAVSAAPSIPMAYSEWGEALLERGQPDAAIEKFKLSNQKGPHFADPLEGWGEALMKKNQSHLALAKFEEADKYAPNWGRLHLKWGEALFYAGKKDEAAKEFTKAAALDLTSDEKSELARHP